MNLTRNVVFDFGDRVLKSYADFGLIQKSAPEVTPPAPKTNYVDVPGANGSIDLSEALMGHVVYDDREIVLHFRRVMPSLDGAQDKRLEDYLHFAACLQGLRCRLYLDEADKFCFDCRLTVGQMSASGDAWDVDVTAVARPYRTTATPTVKTVTMKNTDVRLEEIVFSEEQNLDDMIIHKLEQAGIDQYYGTRVVGYASPAQFTICFIQADGTKQYINVDYDTDQNDDLGGVVIPNSALTDVDPAEVTAIGFQTNYEPWETEGITPECIVEIKNGSSAGQIDTVCTVPSIPKFTCRNDGQTFTIESGSGIVDKPQFHISDGGLYSNPSIILQDSLRIRIVPDTYPDGNGVITITYQEGVL